MKSDFCSGLKMFLRYQTLRYDGVNEKNAIFEGKYHFNSEMPRFGDIRKYKITAIIHKEASKLMLKNVINDIRNHFKRDETVSVEVVSNIAKYGLNYQRTDVFFKIIISQKHAVMIPIPCIISLDDSRTEIPTTFITIGFRVNGKIFKPKTDLQNLL